MFWETCPINRVNFDWSKNGVGGWMVKALNGHQNSYREPYCPGMGVEGLVAVKFRVFLHGYVRPKSHGIQGKK